MRILYKFASRSREHKFFAALDNITHLSISNNYYIIASLDEDDPVMNRPEILARIKNYSHVTVDMGLSKNKIDAINRGVSGEFDIIVCMSDDMEFIKQGFDEAIRRDMIKYFPDLDGVLHYPDGFTENRTMTMSILGRKYYERQGYIYHPDYESVYCDNEETEKAIKLSRYMFINEQLFTHNHPHNLRQPYDELYQKNDSSGMHAKDSETFHWRRLKNFDL